MIIKYCLILISLISSLSAFGSNSKLSVINSKDGLNDEKIFDIELDNQGVYWLATGNGLSKYDGYSIKNYNYSKTNNNSVPSNEIRKLHFDKDNVLWIGTYNNGLASYFKGIFTRYELDANTIYSITSNNTGIIVATDKGLYFQKYGQSFQRLEADKKKYFQNIISVTTIEEQNFIAATNTQILLLNSLGNVEKIFSPTLNGQELKIRMVLPLSTEKYLLATHIGLLQFDIKSLDTYSYFSELNDTIILDVAGSHDDLWIATYNKGVFHYDGELLSNFTANDESSNSLSSNVVLSLYITNNSKWIGTFSGLNSFHGNQLNVQAFQAGTPELKCLGGKKVTNIYEEQEYLLLSTANRFVLFDKVKNECHSLNLDLTNLENNLLSIYDIKKSQNAFFVGTQAGLYSLDVKEKIFNTLYFNKHDNRIYDILIIDNAKLLVATTKGAFYYDISSEKITPIKFEDVPKQIFVYSLGYIDSRQFILSTSKGVFKLSDNSNFAKLLSNDIQDISYTSIVYKDKIYTANYNNKVIVTDLSGNIVKSINLSNTTSTIIPRKLFVPPKSKFIWLTSSNGLFRINPLDQNIKSFYTSDGFQDSNFYLNAYHVTENGKVLLGGKEGFSTFYPEDIKDNLVPPKVALTKLTRFNKEVVAGEDYEGFGIDKPIEYLEELEVGHRDYVIGFEFAGLHYADPMRNQYQYILEGFHEDWVSTDAKNRTATFTNLSPGDYVFRVKAANKDGVWSLDEDNVAFKITVHPAPWLSWWAFTIYGLVILSSILWFIRYRTQSAIARAIELEQEVSLRTKEIETQKNVIESLLERKNELFANISHEFRTPLTLILGPLEKELKALDSPKNPKHLQMIQRNATRLLGMVEQILKLTELKKEDTVNKVPHAVNPALEAISDSFASFAESKQIELSLELDDNANVMAANDALEVMVGNLVSNAIKYTPEAGQVTLKTKLMDGKIQIRVSDTGVGMTKAQQEDVFERFVRLDKTSDIAGTGIGLSIVKELILAHDGQVSVDSIEGEGSIFTISLPTTNQAALSDTLSIKAIEHLTQGDASASEVTQVTEETLTDTQQELVLIIDDNPDMRDYIQEVLSPNYHCTTADRGEAGIELAKAQVPDLIICDIMMPGIDGYEVAKRLREDIITSHIPLVLLTAKGDKESRIQGWNENIDDYMTKPFDKTELKARIANILALRTLIKASQVIAKKHNGSISNQLTDKDKLFIEKLNEVLEKHYQNPLCTRTNIANDMAVSDRQLQRKLKGLINQNPMDYLRNYRLDKGAELISTGKAITLISDLCGFNSASHFIQCFKAKFGVTPKNFK